MKKLIQQYQQIKLKYPDAVILLRAGDLYETFGDDANTLSHQAGITFTPSVAAAPIEMASFPLPALDTQLRTLVKRGYKVAICEALEDSKEAKRQRRKAG